MELQRGYFEIEINGQLVPLRLTMWVLDENRFSNLLAEKEQSVIWKMAAQFYICYLNACRFAKIKPELTKEDFELWVDEKYCFDKDYLVELEAAITEETNKLFGAVLSTAEANTEENEEKKIVGLTPAPLLSAASG